MQRQNIIVQCAQCLYSYYTVACKKRQQHFELFRLQNIKSVVKIKSERQLYIKNKQKYSALVGIFRFVLTY